MEENLKEIFNNRGDVYRYGTTDYYLLDKGNGVVSLFIQSSKNLVNDPIDWVRNFNIVPTRLRIGKRKVYVHKGFKEGFDELLIDLLPRLKKYNTVNIYGYSHGAGIAQILYLYLLESSRFSLSPPILFGCPNAYSILNLRGFLYAKRKCKEIIQIRLGNDIVSRVPCILYAKVGSEMKFKPERDKTYNYFKSLFLDHAQYGVFLNK